MCSLPIIKKLCVVVLILATSFGIFWWWQNYQQTQLNQYKDLVTLTNPVAGGYILSPVVIEGKARGNWFFEASFPVFVVDWDGLIIGQGIAQAQSEWMTTDYVSFRAEISFTKSMVKNNGAIILKKDNPSGLAQYDDAFEVPVFFR
jgi:hypothetical protein